MNPSQLLDPKGWAKQQAKAKGKGKSRMPLGPKQSRKAVQIDTPGDHNGESATPSMATYDPKALLAPGSKVGTLQKHSTQSGEVTSSKNHSKPGNHNLGKSLEDEGLGMADFLDRQHGLKHREFEAPSKRRKIDDSQEHDGPSKSATFSGSGGGSIGQYIRDEQINGSKQNPSTMNTAVPSQQVPIAIDLTNDDDDDDDDCKMVEVVGKKAPQEEVCIGTLKTNVNAHRIPASSAANKLSKDWWPKMRVTLRRQPDQTNVIQFIDTTGKPFGQMVINSASALCPLLDGVNVSKLRTRTYLEARKRRSGEAAGQSISEVLVAFTTFFCPRSKAQSIGRFLSQKQLYLQDPVGAVPGTPVENPHKPKSFAPSTDDARARAHTNATGSGNARYTVRTQEEMRRDAETMFDTLTKANEDLPEAEPSNMITTPLMQHQKKALFFLLDHEKREEPQPSPSADGSAWSLWKPSNLRIGSFYNVITGEETAQPPERIRGGILADVMGLGKTLSILALIATTLSAAAEFSRTAASPEEIRTIRAYSRATLIICPKSVMSNWVDQIKQHTSRKLKVYTYHGATRIQEPEKLADFDIVLTSYNTAAAEFNDGNRRTRALESVYWFRIVLDEAHQIRTASTKVSKAACALSAERRWAMTGTPVQNRLDDLGTLIKFIRLKPFDNYYTWAHYIMAPLKKTDTSVLPHLRLLVDGVTLRRVKDTVNLPQCREVREFVQWSKEERSVYDNFARAAHSQKRRIIGTGGAPIRGKVFAHVFRAINRLRMLCAHGKEMLSAEDLEDFESLQGTTSDMAIELFDEPESDHALEMREDLPFITTKQAYEMLHLMHDSDAHICSLCKEYLRVDKADTHEISESSDDSEDEESDESNSSDRLGVITQSCLHLICSKCEEEHNRQFQAGIGPDGYGDCPLSDGAYVRHATFPLSGSGYQNFLKDREITANRSRRNIRLRRDNYDGQFSKVRSLISHLNANANETEKLPPGEPPIRSVVFSGWTSYLDLIEFALIDESIKFVRLDGTMSVKQRTTVINLFKEDPETTVLLVSIKAGGQGLNFTTANKVYMMEPQFNPGVEQQAIDRVHRLGQERDVEIIHFIMADSIEEEVVRLQEKKTELAQLSMEKKLSEGEETKNKLQKLLDLLK